jgi:hypothetical protein
MMSGERLHEFVYPFVGIQECIANVQHAAARWAYIRRITNPYFSMRVKLFFHKDLWYCTQRA